MRITRFVVVASLVLSMLVLGCAMAFSTLSYSEFTRYGAKEWVQFALIYGIVLAGCAWPWLLSYAVASSEAQRIRVLAFSTVAVVLSGLFYQPISTAPTEGIGYYLIICLLLIWLAYPLTRVFVRTGE